jgi:hypothetical protein
MRVHTAVSNASTPREFLLDNSPKITDIAKRLQDNKYNIVTVDYNM